ncbi:MAG: helix-turn-helix domain-containing protein [Coriobacteriia bacterium]|nr:helix-turn-helix domain-containing protein [Coriobacteriia bacterium]
MTSLGDMLIAARKEAGLSAHDIAQRTRIMQSAIYNLEDDKLDALPVAGYVRGFILSYCKVCDADPQPFLEQFERQSGSNRRDTIGEDLYSGSAQRLGSRHPESEINWRVIIVVVVIIAIIVGAIYLMSRDGTQAAQRATPVSAEVAADDQQDSEDGAVATNDATEDVPEEDRAPFSLNIQTEPGTASNVRIEIDGNLGFDGALLGGSSKSFSDVLLAEIQIDTPENVVVMQNDTEVPIPDDGELTLVYTGSDE